MRAKAAMTAGVVLVASNFPPVRGGSAVVYGNLARCADGQIVVVAPTRNYVDGLPLIGWREHDRRRFYRVVRLPLLRTTISSGQGRDIVRKMISRSADLLIRLRLLAVVLRIIRKERPNAICIGELLACGWLIRTLHYISKIVTVVYVHGEEITTEESYDPMHRRAQKVLLSADRIVVVSRFTQRAVCSLLHEVSDEKICLIENGVDSTRFGPGKKRADLVALYGLEDAFVFVSVCRLLEKKGIDNAIRAFSVVAAKYPGCRYLIVGTGPYAEDLRQIAAECGVSDLVSFAGEVSDVDLVDHYRLGDVFVMPNRELANGDTEGFGLVFLEANACGLAVIAGRDGGSRDAVQHGVNGLVVDGQSVSEIAEAMLALHEDRELRNKMSCRALEVARTADWRGKTEAFLHLCAARRAG